MAFPDLAVNLIYTILCLVPGFISLQIITYTANLDAEMSEFEKSTWSLIGSGVSLSLLYFLYVIWLGIVTRDFMLIRSLDLGWVELVAVYPLLLFVAVLVGYVSAKVLIWTRGTPTRGSIENWSGAVFLVAGGLFLINTLHEGLARYTALFEGGVLNVVVYLSALIVMLVGLLGLSPRLADWTPRLARASAVIAAIAGISTVVLLLWASSTQLLNQSLPPGILVIVTVTLIVLAIILFCIASLKTGTPLRAVGLLLLVFVATWLGVFGVVMVYGPANWIAIFVNGVSFIVLLAIGYLLRTKSALTDREEAKPAPDSPVR